MCHALIIEDEPLIADYVATLAEEAGATSVDFADCKADALSTAHGHRPDIILSDVKLQWHWPCGGGQHSRRMGRDPGDLHHWHTRRMHPMRAARRHPRQAYSISAGHRRIPATCVIMR